MYRECKTYDEPNKSVVQATKVTDQYTEIHAIENRERYGYDQPILVVLDQGDNANADISLAVVAATNLSEAMNFVADYYGLSVEDQKFENSHIDLHGQNAKYLFMYIAQDAPGWSVAYGMNTLVSVNYDVQDVLDSYLMP